MTAQGAEHDMLVQELMTSEPSTVTGETHVKTAVDLLARRRVSSLPVVDAHGRIRGVVCEVDLIRDAIIPDIRAHLLPGEGSHRHPATLVSEVMSSPAITVHEKTDLAEVVELMATARLKSLPVVDNEERVVGIISRSDVIRTRARADQDVAGDIDSLLDELGHEEWLVEVQEGAVHIKGPHTALERSIAEVAAATVPGVVAVEVSDP
jgi:CBS domain-containing protein